MIHSARGRAFSSECISSASRIISRMTWCVNAAMFNFFQILHILIVYNFILNVDNIKMYHHCQCFLDVIRNVFPNGICCNYHSALKLNGSEEDDEDDRFVLKVCSHFGFQVSFMNF